MCNFEEYSYICGARFYRHIGEPCELGAIGPHYNLRCRGGQRHVIDKDKFPQDTICFTCQCTNPAVPLKASGGYWNTHQNRWVWTLHQVEEAGKVRLRETCCQMYGIREIICFLLGFTGALRKDVCMRDFNWVKQWNDCFSISLLWYFYNTYWCCVIQRALYNARCWLIPPSLR